MALGAAQLPLADHVHCFDSGDDDSCTPKRLKSEYRLGDSFDGSMVLPGDVVEVFALTHQDINAGVSLDALNGCCVGATLVDGDLIWHIVQADRSRSENPQQAGPCENETLQPLPPRSAQWICKR